VNLLGVYQIHTEYNILEVYPDGFLFCVGYGVPCHNEADCNNCKVHMEYMVSYLDEEQCCNVSQI